MTYRTRYCVALCFLKTLMGVHFLITTPEMHHISVSRARTLKSTGAVEPPFENFRFVNVHSCGLACLLLQLLVLEFVYFLFGVSNQYCNIWLQNSVQRVSIIIKHKCVYVFILWLMSLLVFKSYFSFSKVGPTPVQQCRFYLHSLLLLLLLPWGVHICNHVYVYRSGCNTRFTLYSKVVGLRYSSIDWVDYVFRLNPSGSKAVHYPQSADLRCTDLIWHVPTDYLCDLSKCNVSVNFKMLLGIKKTPLVAINVFCFSFLKFDYIFPAALWFLGKQKNVTKTWHKSMNIIILIIVY